MLGIPTDMFLVFHWFKFEVKQKEVAPHGGHTEESQ